MQSAVLQARVTSKHVRMSVFVEGFRICLHDLLIMLLFASIVQLLKWLPYTHVLRIVLQMFIRLHIGGFVLFTETYQIRANSSMCMLLTLLD
jgi:hypothetical protein